MEKSKVILFLLLFFNITSASENTHIPDNSNSFFSMDKIKDLNLELGYSSNSGNTSSSSINTKIGLEHISNAHRNKIDFRYIVSEKDNIEDKNQTSLDIQHSYKIKGDIYLYSNLSLNATKYSSYLLDSSVTTGIGYDWHLTPAINIEAEMGLGYRYQEPNLDEIDDDDLIFPEDVSEGVIRGSLSFDYNIDDKINFKYDITTVSGQSSTKYTSVFGIETYINDSFSINLENRTEFINKVPPGLENKDKEILLNFKYVFI